MGLFDALNFDMMAAGPKAPPVPGLTPPPAAEPEDDDFGGLFDGLDIEEQDRSAMEPQDNDLPRTEPDASPDDAAPDPAAADEQPAAAPVVRTEAEGFLPEDAEYTAARITENAMFLEIGFSGFGNTRKVEQGNIAVIDPNTKELLVHDGMPDGDPTDEQAKKKVKRSRLHTTKKLLDSPELQAIESHKGKMKKFIESESVGGTLGKSLFPIPLVNVKRVHETLKGMADEYYALVEAAVEKYPQRCEEASLDLGVLHDPGQYMSAEAFRKEFSVEWEFKMFGVPDTLKQIDAALWNDANQKYQAKMLDAAAEMRLAMRSLLSDLVGNLMSALEPGEDGKRKKLHKATVEKVFDFLQSFEEKNTVLGDTELQEQVEKARLVLQGVNVDSLKGSDDFRASVLAELQNIKPTLDCLVEKAPSRRFKLDGMDD